jgi:hypothetical protein
VLVFAFFSCHVIGDAHVLKVNISGEISFQSRNRATPDHDRAIGYS